jgi:hypothetical protein
VSSRALLSSMISVAISHTVSEQLLMDSCRQQQMQVGAGTNRQQGSSHGLVAAAGVSVEYRPPSMQLQVFLY